jgi:hypothetical protein
VPDNEVPEVVSFDTARKCPECSHTGKLLHSNAILGGTVHKLECMNPVCPWFQTFWFVETNANGEVQVNEEATKAAKGERLIAPTDPSFDANFALVHQMLDRQLEEETRGRGPT